MWSVSVIIPAYNSEKYIKRSIDSILHQSVLPIEVIVVDDGSTDHTADIAKSYGGIVKLISKGRNCGTPAARNFGIANAKGEWIAFLDSDDEWLYKKNEVAVDLVKSHHTDWCMVAQTDVYNRYINKATTNHMPVGKKIYENYFSLFLKGKSCCPSSIMIRKSLFLKTGGFNEKLSTGEDLEMWWRIANTFPIISYFTQPMVKYYVAVPGSMTASPRDEKRLIAFWDAVMQISDNRDDARTSILFKKVRNNFASKAIRFYFREGYYDALSYLKKIKTLTPSHITRSLLMLPDEVSTFICKIMYRLKNNYLFSLLLKKHF